MLLARAGYRVLVADRATFPSDTISTHLIHPPGVAALRRWGLLDAWLQSSYYSYYSGLPVDGRFENYIRLYR